MKSADFKQLLITAKRGNLTIDKELEIDGFDLSDLDQFQWEALGKELAHRNATGLKLSECNTHTFSDSTWQALFAIIAKAHSMTKFTVNKDPLPRYQDATWKSIFKHMPGQIKKLGFRFCDLGDVTLGNYPSLLRGLTSSQYDELDLSGNLLALSDSEKRFYLTLISILSNAPCLKRLLLCFDDFWSEDNYFWADKDINFEHTSLVYLGLDSTNLNEVSEKIWLQFCDRIASSQISSLSIENNELDTFKPENWPWFFEGLSKTKVTELYIDDLLKLNTLEKETAFFNALRESKITAIRYKHEFNHPFTLAQETILHEILEANKSKLTSTATDSYPHLMVTTFAHGVRKTKQRQCLEKTGKTESESDEDREQSSPHNGMVASKRKRPQTQ